MARRDVDLVIKARDEAANVVESITKALDEFTQAQQNLDARSEKTEGTLSALGAAIGKLDKDLKGLSAGEALTSELARAENALARLTNRFEDTQGEAKQLEQNLRGVQAQTERYTQKLAGAAAAQERQAAAVKRAKEDQRELTAAYERVVAAQDKLERRQTKLPGLIDRASASADKAATRFGELSAKMQGTVQPSRTLQQQFEASQRSVTTTAARLNSLQNEYAQISGQLRQAGANIQLFGQQADAATANVARQEAIFERITTNLNELKVQSGAASRQQSKLAGEFAKTNASLARQGQEIERAKGNYVELAQSVGTAEATLRRLASGGLATLEKQFRDQRRAVLETKREYLEARDAATRLGAAVAKTTSPTRELVASFEQAKVTSSRLKQELLENRVAYEQLGGTLRGTSADINSVRAAQQQFANIQQGLAQRLNASAAAADRQSRQINQLRGTTNAGATASERLARRQERLATANQRLAGSTSQLDVAFRRFYGGTRQSLSILQRIRGEVLSLAAAYGGLFAAIEVLRGTVDATQQLEAAQARLGVAFDQDQTRVASELDFLRRTANRLGVDIGTLATEYSKFNVATKNTSLEGANARKIFVQVAEAARVNRSSTKELSGVFVALTQIVSKGAVQMEELRQQLGDRLPGALKIMADGLNVTTAELVKMLEQGQVTEAALIPFGDELERRFGPGLGEALASTNVAIGRLGNAAFQALVKFGNAGFIESFKEFVETLTETLQSADFEAFAARVSSALGGLIDLLGFFAANFQLVFIAVTGFVGLRLSPLVIAVAGSFAKLNSTLKVSSASFTAVQARAAAAGVTITRTGFAVRNLTRAMRGLLASTGIGLAVTAISIGLGAWATRGDEATEALNEHRKIVDQVKDAYDAVGGSVAEWQEALADLTATELEGNMRRIKDALGDIQGELDSVASGNSNFLTNFFGTNLSNGREIFDVSGRYQKAIQNIVKEFRAGRIPADQYLAQLDEVNQQYADAGGESSRYGEAIIELARKELELSGNVEEANAALAAKTGTVEEATEAAKALGIANEEAADALDPEKTAAFTASMSELQKIIDDTTQSTKFLEQAMQIEGAFEDAIANAQTLEERVLAAITRTEALSGAASQFVDANFGNFTDGIEASAALIREFEGFRATPYFDVNAQRAGFGSDTVTLADGTIVKVVEGMRVSIEDANRDLYRRIETEFRPIAERASGGRFGSFTPQQQAALTSIAYNYGEIPDRIGEAIRSGSDEQIASAIRSLASDNQGVNRNRRFQEAALFTSGAAVDTGVREAERLAEEQERRREATEETLRNNQFEIAQQQLVLQGKQRQAEIENAIREARRENPEITAAEIAQIEEQTGKLFDMEQQEKNRKTAKEQAQAAEEEVNRLLTIQNSLREQLAIAEETGDNGRAIQLKDEINGVNTEILSAIDNAILMWEAIGGSAADAAIAKLETAKVRAENLGFEAEKNYLQWDRLADLFVTGLSSAFDSFAQSVANGESIADSAKAAFLQFAADFLRQIANMIIQQAIFNALQSSFGGTSFGNLIGLPTGHTGGLVGSSRIGSGNSTRFVNPAAFAGAARYHTGGIAGMRPGEVPAILKAGEEVLTRDDPRHMLNSAAKTAASGGGGIKKIINAFDGSDALDQALSENAGQDTFLNYVRKNKGEVRALLGL